MMETRAEIIRKKIATVRRIFQCFRSSRAFTDCLIDAGLMGSYVEGQALNSESSEDRLRQKRGQKTSNLDETLGLETRQAFAVEERERYGQSSRSGKPSEVNRTARAGQGGTYHQLGVWSEMCTRYVVTVTQPSRDDD